MNTPAHLIMGAAAFGNPNALRVTWAALFGAFLPDMSLYVMAGVSIFLLGYAPNYVFDVLYYSDAWQQVFAIDNSFVLWGLVLVIAIWRHTAWMIALCGAALLHLALDFPLHNHDARMHFWPLSDWKFISPVSYWETARGGFYVGLAGMALVAALVVYLFRQFDDMRLRITFAAIAALEIAPAIMFRVMF